MSEKHYPMDPLGAQDAGARREVPKPCTNRIDHGNEVIASVRVTWCSLPSGHTGQCSGPPPREIPATEAYAMRLRGLANDQFADRFEARNVRKEAK